MRFGAFHTPLMREAWHAADMRSRAVSIADLKTNLTTHLARVRSGEEIIIRDQRAPIAKNVPLVASEDVSESDIALVTAGKARLPQKKLPASFWKTSGPRVATDRALEILREERSPTPSSRAFPVGYRSLSY